MSSYKSNNEDTVQTDVARFMLTQRNAGFANNDGRWVVSQLAELYWSNIGTLRQKRSGIFLGVFDTRIDADTAIRNAELQPIDDRMVV